MTTREKINALEGEMLQQMAAMKKSDGKSSKCYKMGISFAEEYPKDYEEYIAANHRYNSIEEELSPLYEQLAKEEAEEIGRKEADDGNTI